MEAPKISTEAQEKATLCNKDFACLDCVDRLCPVTESIKYVVLFVEPVDRAHCKYRMRLRDRFYCDCPARKEIYKKYGI